MMTLTIIPDTTSLISGINSTATDAISNFSPLIEFIIGIIFAFIIGYILIDMISRKKKMNDDEDIFDDEEIDEDDWDDLPSIDW